MNQAIPTTTFEGCLKQLLLRHKSAQTRDAFSRGFPNFLLDLGQTPGKGLYRIGGLGEVPNPGTRFRRYAGDNSLSAERYFSVCDAETFNGNDGGALVHELQAYAETSAEYGVVELIDSSVNIEAAKPWHEYLRKTVGTLYMQPFLCFSMGSREFDTKENEWVMTISETHLVEFQLTKAELANTLDLRLRRTQDWFCDVFGKLEAGIGLISPSNHRAAKLPPESFRQLLPSLLSQPFGGGSFHQAVGAWLRSNGVTAFVYPSARCDVHVESNDREVLSSYGWHLVLYANDGIEVDCNKLFAQQLNWLKEDRVGVSVDWKDDGKTRSWTVKRLRPSRGERPGEGLAKIPQVTFKD